MGRLRLIGTNAALVAGALLLVFVCLEVYFRSWSPQRSDPGGMFVPHPELGWTFAPSRRGAIVYPGEAAHYLQTNALSGRAATRADASLYSATRSSRTSAYRGKRCSPSGSKRTSPVYP